jgi:drug/metabolite transporter (DMT)-like permease
MTSREPRQAGAAHGKPDGRAVAALVCVQVLFGLHYLAAKVVVQEIAPRPWAFLRATSAGLLLLALVALRGIPIPTSRSRLLPLAGLALIGVAVNQWLFVEGLRRTSPGHSALINTSIPVVVLLVAFLMGRERPTPRRLCGIVLTLAGVLLLVGPEQFDWRADSVRGDLLTLVNALSYSIFLVVGKPFLERERTLPASALLLLFGGLWLAPIGAPRLARIDAGSIDTRTWLLGLFIVLGPTVGAYALSTYALRRVEASVVALFIYLQPLLGAGLSLALGFEPPAPRLFAAGAIVFAGVYLAVRAPGRPPPVTTPVAPEP